MELAATYIEGGASWIHVVDLDAARTGVPHERKTLARIVELASGAGGAGGAGVKVQTGGGIRREDDVAAVLDVGVARVVMGTAALEDPALAARCARRWPGRSRSGWTTSCDPTVSPRPGRTGGRGLGADPARAPGAVGDEPLGAVVATAIAHDGMLGGSDLVGLGALLDQAAPGALAVIASGGVGTLDDLRDLALVAPDQLAQLEGVIVGKALVEGRFSVKEAMAACAASG